MAKPNYQFEKRQRDLEKKKKKEEKAQRKQDKNSDAPDADTATDTLSSPAEPSPTNAADPAAD